MANRLVKNKNQKTKSLLVFKAMRHNLYLVTGFNYEYNTTGDVAMAGLPARYPDTGGTGKNDNFATEKLNWRRCFVASTSPRSTLN